MHTFGQTFSKFHNAFERAFFYPKGINNKTRLQTSPVLKVNTVMLQKQWFYADVQRKV